MVGKLSIPIQWLRGHVPRNQAQLESELRVVMKVVFWLTLLAPVIILPAYYLAMALLR